MDWDRVISEHFGVYLDFIHRQAVKVTAPEMEAIEAGFLAGMAASAAELKGKPLLTAIEKRIIQCIAQGETNEN